MHEPPPTLCPSDPLSQNVSQQFDFSFVWINEFTIAAQRIDTQHHQLCARTLSIIITNQFMKTEHIPRQVYFSKNIVHSFVQFGVSQQQSHISDRYFREIQSSIITTNQSMKRELTPPQGLFQTRNVCAFVQFGVSQQQSNISDLHFRGTQSSNIITNQSMKTEHIPRQELFQTRNVCGFMNLLCSNVRLTFPIGIFVATNHLTS